MSIGLSGNRIQLWVILVHLQELSAIWIVNKVKSVRSWSGKTKYLISFIVFKHKMNVMLLDFLIAIESLWNHKVVGCLLCLEGIKIERRWGWSDVNLTSFHLRSYCPNRAVTTKLVLSLNFSILKHIKQQKEKIFILFIVNKSAFGIKLTINFSSKYYYNVDYWPITLREHPSKT